MAYSSEAGPFHPRFLSSQYCLAYSLGCRTKAAEAGRAMAKRPNVAMMVDFMFSICKGRDDPRKTSRRILVQGEEGQMEKPRYLESQMAQETKGKGRME